MKQREKTGMESRFDRILSSLPVFKCIKSDVVEKWTLEILKNQRNTVLMKALIILPLSNELNGKLVLSFFILCL